MLGIQVLVTKPSSALWNKVSFPFTGTFLKYSPTLQEVSGLCTSPYLVSENLQLPGIFFSKYQFYDYIHVHVDVWIQISELRWDTWDFLFWYFERVCFCSPGWPGIGDPPDCWDYRCVAPPRKDLCAKVPQLLYSHLDERLSRDAQWKWACHATVPCFSSWLFPVPICSQASCPALTLFSALLLTFLADWFLYVETVQRLHFTSWWLHLFLMLLLKV